MNRCTFCSEPVYVKVIQYAAPIAAPLTPEQELRDRLTNVTGEVYVQLDANYCPMCGQLKNTNKNAPWVPEDYNFEVGM